MNPEPQAATTQKDDSAEVALAVATTAGHYLGAGQSVGDYLRHVGKVRGRVAALLVRGLVCWAFKDRDRPSPHGEVRGAGEAGRDRPR